jgi:23S rRNA pseudouridine955/2504/2580 synthase/23S rRNA pseudouridine1911/1915/1917 synthase
VPPGGPAESLLEFLVRRFTYHTRDAWQSRLADGRVQVNGLPARTDVPLGSGDRLDYDIGDLPEPPVDIRYAVLFEDADILIADKPGNLPCHPSGAYFNHTLWALLKSRAGLENPAFVNRLDRETSGLVVVAKNTAAAKACGAEFAGRRVEKNYLVLVEGLFPDTREARGAMRENPAESVRKRRLFVEGVTPDEAGSDWAETRFRRLATGGGISLVEAAPSTGRLHQIRATLHACGYPVVGDKLYGVDPELFLRFRKGELTGADRAALRLDRQALHAVRLRMRHPRTHEWLEWEAPLPGDMADLARACHVTCIRSLRHPANIDKGGQNPA